MSGVYANGGGQNASEYQAEKAKFMKIADNVARGVGAAAMIAGGITFTEKASNVWMNAVHASYPSDGMIEKLATTSVLGASGAGMAAGVAVAAAGACVAYKMAKDHNLKTKFLRAAVKTKNSKLGQKIDKFAHAAKMQVAKGMDVYAGTEYKYTIVDTPKSKHEDKPYKAVRQAPKVLSDFLKRKFGGRQ